MLIERVGAVLRWPSGHSVRGLVVCWDTREDVAAIRSWLVSVRGTFPQHLELGDTLDDQWAQGLPLATVGSIDWRALLVSDDPAGLHDDARLGPAELHVPQLPPQRVVVVKATPSTRTTMGAADSGRSTEYQMVGVSMNSAASSDAT